LDKIQPKGGQCCKRECDGVKFLGEKPLKKGAYPR
jgi:hypothetical protein